MGDTDFTDLVNEAEQLATEIEGGSELPKIERSLRQVLEASHVLWSRVSRTGAQDIQANLLLGTKGLDLPQITQKLQSLSAQRTFEPLDPVPLTDIPTFLKNERENAILQLIESTHDTTFKDVSRMRKIKCQEDWKKHKTTLMNSLLGYSKQIIDVPQRSQSWVAGDDILNSSGAGWTIGTGGSTLSQNEMVLSRCLSQYHMVDLSNVTSMGTSGGFTSSPGGEKQFSGSLLSQFIVAVESLGNQKLLEMWRQLKAMTELPPLGAGDPLKARADSMIQQAMINRALSYLETRYKAYMTGIVNSNLNNAKRGGVPGTLSLVRGFVSVYVRQLEGLDDIKIDGLPLWPLVYYCIRCGDLSAALTCFSNTGVVEEEMVAALQDLKESPNRRLTLRVEMQLKSSYRRLVRTSNDRYKRAVYCILAACDVHDDHKEVATTADDFLWLKLCQVREEEKEPVPDRLHYQLLQTLVLEQYGEIGRKTIAGNTAVTDDAPVYFQALCLTGQWEAGIDLLVHSDRYRMDAVHMALALNDMGILALPATVNSPLLVIDSSDRPPMRRLNLLRLVLLYTQRFDSTDPGHALNYYYCLRHLTSNDGKNAFVSCVTDLVLETKQYDTLLGMLLEDGRWVPGLVEKFQSNTISVKSIIEAVAESTEQKGLYEDAVKLYDLCGIHEKVLSLMNTLLGQTASAVASSAVSGGTNVSSTLSRTSAVCNSTTSLSQRARIAHTAARLCARYDGIELTCTPATLSTFYLLLDLVAFFDLYHSNQYVKALDTMHQTRLIPECWEELDEKVNNFKLLDETVTRNIPEILLALMNIYYRQYQQAVGDTNASKIDDPVVAKKVSFLREKAKLITAFTGTIPYRMPGGMNSRLVQLEIMMN